MHARLYASVCVAGLSVRSEDGAEVSQLSTLSDLVERLDKLVNYLPEEGGGGVSDPIPIQPADCDDRDTNTDYP